MTAILGYFANVNVLGLEIDSRSRCVNCNVLTTSGEIRYCSGAGAAERARGSSIPRRIVVPAFGSY